MEKEKETERRAGKEECVEVMEGAGDVDVYGEGAADIDEVPHWQTMLLL